MREESWVQSTQMINARAETVSEKPAFKRAFRSPRRDWCRK
jgi:putative SOS response-associated peptidase YedK